MSRPPEAFLIFRAELKRVELEKEKIRKLYEDRLAAMGNELGYLKEQIAAQEGMLKTAFEYASKLEKEMKCLRSEMKIDQRRLKQSLH